MMIHGLAAKNLKETIASYDWWKFVRPDIQSKIDFVLNNLQQLGIPFRDSFVSYFRLEHTKRIITGNKLTMPKMPFQTITEECLQSAINPTKHLLGLDDWVLPNDAEVQACMCICHNIDLLEDLGILKYESESESQ